MVDEVTKQSLEFQVKNLEALQRASAALTKLDMAQKRIVQTQAGWTTGLNTLRSAIDQWTRKSINALKRLDKQNATTAEQAIVLQKIYKSGAWLEGIPAFRQLTKELGVNARGFATLGKLALAARAKLAAASQTANQAALAAQKANAYLGVAATGTIGGGARTRAAQINSANIFARSQQQLARLPGITPSWTVGLEKAVAQQKRAADPWLRGLDRLAQQQRNAARAAQEATTANDRLTQSVRRGTAATHNYGITWTGVARIMIGTVVARAVYGFIFAIDEAIRKVVEFQIRISEVRTISQRNQLAFDRWASSLRNLSDSFGLDILDTVEGAYDAISNQIAEGAQTTQFMAEAMRLALITTATTEEAVNLLSGAINAYNLNISDARRLSSIFFKVIDLGKIRASELQQNLGLVAITGKQLGVSIEELGAAIAVLTRQGIEPAVAMTGLRNVMLKLIRPTDYMKGILASWGTPTAEAAVATYGFGGVLQKIAKIAEESKDPLNEIAQAFGRIRAITAATGLTLEEAFKNYAATLSEITGAAQETEKAFKLIKESAGFRLRVELNKLKNIFVVDIAQALIKSLDTMNTALGGISNIFSALVKNFETARYVLTGMGTALLLQTGYVALMNTKFIAALKWVNSINRALIFGRVVTASFATSLNFAALAAAGIGAAIGYAIARTIQMRRAAQRTYDELFTSEIISRRQAAQEIIAKEQEFLKDRAALWKGVGEEQVRIFKQYHAFVSAQIDRIKALKGEAEAIGKIIRDILLGRKTGAAKQSFLIENIQENLAKLRKYEPGKSDFKEHSKRISDTLDLLNQLKDVEKELREKAGKQSRFTKTGMVLIGGPRKKEIYSAIKLENQLLSILKKQQEATEGLSNVSDDYLDSIEKSLNTYFTEAQKREGLILQAQQFNAELEKQNTLYKENSANIKSNLEALRSAIPTYKQGADTQPIEGPPTRVIQKLAEIRKAAEELDKLSDPLLANGVKVAALVNQLEAYKKLLQTYPSTTRQTFRIPGIDDIINQLNAGRETGAAAKEKFAELREAVDNVNNSLAEAKGIMDGAKAVLNDFINLNLDAVSNLTTGMDLYKDAINATTEAYQSLYFITQQYRHLIETPPPAIIPPEFKEGGYFGKMLTRAFGGSVGRDSIPLLGSPGEFMMNAAATRQFLPQLMAMNSGPQRLNAGGNVTNNNVGDIHLTVQNTSQQPVDGKSLASAIRRELRRNTARLN